jgi:hypothetical protein
MKKITLVLLLVSAGCSSSQELRVTSYRTVESAEAAPWPSGCLVTVESKTQRVVGVYGVPCDHIQIGDLAIFNHKGDSVFWVNNAPYSVKSAQAK